jgi:hypothetical protein
MAMAMARRVTVMAVMATPILPEMAIMAMIARQGGQRVGQQQAGEDSGNEFFHDIGLHARKNAQATVRLTSRL